MADTDQTTSQKHAPDDQTRDRIKNLAVVGTAINQLGGSEVSYDTDYFVAKEALNRFMEGIDRLDLDYESHEGMVNLVKYLQKKIDKRMKNANNQNQSPLT